MWNEPRNRITAVNGHDSHPGHIAEITADLDVSTSMEPEEPSHEVATNREVGAESANFDDQVAR